MFTVSCIFFLHTDFILTSTIQWLPLLFQMLMLIVNANHQRLSVTLYHPQITDVTNTYISHSLPCELKVKVLSTSQHKCTMFNLNEFILYSVTKTVSSQLAFSYIFSFQFCWCNNVAFFIRQGQGKWNRAQGVLSLVHRIFEVTLILWSNQ